MITYDFKCDACQVIETHFEDVDLVTAAEHRCPHCSQKMRRLFSSPRIKVAFRAGHDPYTGLDFGSQRQRENYMAENGIIKGE